MALAVTWSGYADTDLDVSSFFAKDHTVCARFLWQYPNAYTGPMVSVNGGGTYVLGQGDFYESPSSGQNIYQTGGPKVVLKVGSAEIAVAANLTADGWHHLAAVRHGNQFSLYLDGKNVGQTGVPASGLPSGKMRFGKTAAAAQKDGGGAQFYGLLDDVAFFASALSASDIQTLAAAHHLSGKEAHLIAGYTFGYVPQGGLPASLSHPVTLTDGAWDVTVSANRDGGADAKSLPLSLVSFMHVPFPQNQAINVIQGFDDPNYSHKGYASFCLDLDLAGEPQSDSFDKPFYAAGAGTVDAVVQTNPSGPVINYIGVVQTPGETCDYLHLDANTAVVKPGGHVSLGDHVANMSDVGAGIGAFHLHIALTNLGEAHKSTGTFVTIPLSFCNYDASDDQGGSWHHVRRGVPKIRQWIRRPAPSSAARYTAVWEPHRYGELQIYGATQAELKATYDTYWPKGLRLKSIASYVDDQPRYTAVWTNSTEGEKQVYGWQYHDYRTLYDTIWKQGWRLKLLSVAVSGGTPLYTAVWRPSTEGEVQIYGAPYAQYRAEYDKLWGQGWRLKQLCVFVVNGQPLYTAVWHPSTAPERQIYDATYAQYRAEYDKLWGQGWRLKLIAPYWVNGDVRYTAVFEPGSSGELQVYGWEYEDYRPYYDVLWQKGWRLKLLSPYAMT